MRGRNESDTPDLCTPIISNSSRPNSARKREREKERKKREKFAALYVHVWEVAAIFKQMR